MTRRTTVGLAAAGLLALASVARAQEPAADPGHHGTMTQEEVKTWTAEINGKQYGVHPWAPSYEGTTGLFHMPVAYTLPKGKFSFSLFRDNLDRDPKDEDISIHGLSLGWGATDKLEIFGNFGLQNRIDADALFQAGFVNDYPFVATPWETGFGDIKLGAKYKFLDDYMGDAVGLAVRGFVKLPTADDEKGLGTGKTAFGADLIISKSLSEKADIHGSLGYQVNSDPDGVDLGNAFKWGTRPQHPRLLLHPAAGRAGRHQLQRGRQRLRADEPARPRGRPDHLVQARLLHPSRALLEPELQRPRAQPGLEELDRPPHLDRLPPRRRLQGDLHAAAAAAAAVERQPDGVLRGRALEPAAGRDHRRARHGVRSRRRPAHLRLERDRGQRVGQRPGRDLQQRRHVGGLVLDRHGPRVRRPQRHRLGELPGERRRPGGPGHHGDLHVRRLPAEP